MTFYQRIGDVPDKRHTQFRSRDGLLLHEELMGQDGFSSASSLLYHSNPPTGVLGIERSEWPELISHPNDPLRPVLLDGLGVEAGGDVVSGRRIMFRNSDVAIGFVRPDETSCLYRNVAGDELIYVMSGAMTLESSFGVLDVSAGDYVVIPRSTTHRWVTFGQPLSVLVVETTGHVGPPARYFSSRGQFAEHAPFCERDLHGPVGPLIADDRPASICVRSGSRTADLHLAHHPFDVVGWDGCLYPYRFNIGDFEPITGRVHQPPTVHQTFEGPGFVVCSFVPRLFDYHPLAIPVPYSHSNTDSDEVLVYVDGTFMSRTGLPLRQGSVTLHPGGFVHGPHPGSVEASIGKHRTEETAVMIDTFAPLELTDTARTLEDPDYIRSWLSFASNDEETK
ncbi:MAG: homogentisate 1,2-dioxygenase [Acidimicrobiales bacterium]